MLKNIKNKDSGNQNAPIAKQCTNNQQYIIIKFYNKLIIYTYIRLGGVSNPA